MVIEDRKNKKPIPFDSSKNNYEKYFFKLFEGYHITKKGDKRHWDGMISGIPCEIKKSQIKTENGQGDYWIDSVRMAEEFIVLNKLPIPIQYPEQASMKTVTIFIECKDDKITKLLFVSTYDLLKSFEFSEEVCRPIMTEYNKYKKRNKRNNNQVSFTSEELELELHARVIEFKDDIVKDEKKKKSSGPIAVDQLNSNKDLIETFESMAAASRKTGIDAAIIRKLIDNGKQDDTGNYWKRS